MGVVVQLQLNSDKAGVIFTRHPRVAHYLLIEACWGQGEGVVSGEVEAHRFEVNKADKKLVKKERNKTNNYKYSLDPNLGGLLLLSYDEEGYCLTSREIRELCEVGIELEQLYGFPLDIEFAYENGELYLLQCRPITVLSGKNINSFEWTPPGPGDWSIDLSHHPLASSPIFAETFANGISTGFEQSCDYYGVVNCLKMRVVNGFMYQTVFQRDLQSCLEKSQDVFKSKRWRHDLEYWNTVVKPKCIKKNKEYQRIDVTEFSSVSTFVSHLKELLEWCIQSTIYHHRFNITAVLPIGDFMAHVLKWSHNLVSPSDLLLLLSGYSDVSNGIPTSLQLHLIEAFSRSELATEILYDKSMEPSAILHSLAHFEGEVGEYIREYVEGGVEYRLVDGYDCSNPIGKEVESMVLSSIQKVVNQSNDKSKRENDNVEKIKSMIGKEHHQQFDELLEEARLVYSLRDERGLFTDLWSWGIFRWHVIEAGKKWISSERVEDYRHLLYCSLDELFDIFLDDSIAPSKQLLAEREKFRLQYDYSIAPRVLHGEKREMSDEGWSREMKRIERAVKVYIDNWMISSPDCASNNSSNILTGIAASQGRYTGTAKVVFTAKDFEKIEEGDVVVAYVTNASFNVVMPKLGGIVTEHGGILTHSGILAREFEIPCVVGCASATKLINCGSKVIVDGFEGTVTILDD